MLNQLDLTSQLQTLMAELDEAAPAPSNIEEGRLLLRAAQKTVREITMKAANLRITFLEDQASKLDDTDEAKAALIRK